MIKSAVTVLLRKPSILITMAAARWPVNMGRRFASGFAALYLIALASFVLIALAGDAFAKEPSELPAGALKNSASPYLREASAGPVRWQPWAKPSLELAAKLNRPLLIDIGAIWCHWCHVMDQMTYSDPMVASLINRSFVPIKIDRDQRPDLDSYYQNAAARLTGASGWPLTCFAFPDGALFIAFGFMPPRADNSDDPSMVSTLEKISDAYSHRRDQLQKGAHRFAAEITSAGATRKAAPKDPEQLRVVTLSTLLENFDPRHGGFGSGPGSRFLDFTAIQLALDHGFHGHPEFTNAALDSLRKIARGGVYDQLGGGFHRYSTDAGWRVPHFEKMAADQALALQVYTRAYQVSGNAEFRTTALGIIDYVNANLLDPSNHTFFAHQDADSFAGDDGSYYTWTEGELRKILDAKELNAAELFFGIRPDPAKAPDGRFVLHQALTHDQLAAKLGVSKAQALALIERALTKLVSERNRRKPPLVDKTVLTDRNALMADAYLTAADAFGRADLLQIAQNDLDYLWDHARTPSGAFDHLASESKGSVTGLLSDQIYMLRALEHLAQATQEKRYLERARSLADAVLRDFKAPSSALLSDQPSKDEPSLLKASMPLLPQLLDMNQAPAPTALAPMVLIDLADLTYDGRYRNAANQMLADAAKIEPPSDPTLAATLVEALEQQHNGSATVVVASEHVDGASKTLVHTANETFRPWKVVTTATGADRKLPAVVEPMLQNVKRGSGPLAFVCSGKACANPTSDANELRKLIQTFGIEGAPAVR